MNDWKKEFERLSHINNGYYEKRGMLVGCDQCGGNLDKDAVKAFIQSILDQKAKEIEGLKDLKQQSDRWRYSSGEVVVYNQALDQALTILKGGKQ